MISERLRESARSPHLPGQLLVLFVLVVAGCGLNSYQRWHLHELRAKFKQRIHARVRLQFEYGEYADSLGKSTAEIFEGVLGDVFDSVATAVNREHGNGSFDPRIVISIVNAGHQEPKLTCRRSAKMPDGKTKEWFEPEPNAPFECFVVYAAKIVDREGHQRPATIGRGEGAVGYRPSQSPGSVFVQNAYDNWARASYANAQARAAEKVLAEILSWQGWNAVTKH